MISRPFELYIKFIAMKTDIIIGSIGFFAITGIIAIAYIEKFRGVKKSLIRIATGKHEIERMTQNNDF
jgi:hypothetical protein